MYAKGNYFFHQGERQRFVERKLNRALRCFVFSQFGFKCDDAARCRIEAYMVLVRREMYEVAVQIEGRHLVADLLGGIGRGFANRLA